MTITEQAAFYELVKKAFADAPDVLELGVAKQFWFSDKRFASLPTHVQEDLASFFARRFQHITGALVP